MRRAGDEPASRFDPWRIRQFFVEVAQPVEHGFEAPGVARSIRARDTISAEDYAVEEAANMGILTAPRLPFAWQRRRSTIA